jgi:hypothetical protein
MKTLKQWLEQVLSTPEGSDTGITTIVHVPFSLTLFQGQDSAGNLTGEIAIEINFPPGAANYVLLGQIETAETREAPSPGELPDIMLKAFNIKPADAIWDDEPL